MEKHVSANDVMREREDTEVVDLEHPVSASDDGGFKVLNFERANVKANIGPLSLLSLAFNINNSWAGIAGSLQIALLQGGPVTLLYGMFISTFIYLCDALTLAELASVYPTAGGQYHFVSILSPTSINLFASYFCGIFTMFAWAAVTAAVTYIPTEMIVAMIQVYHRTYERQTWHLFLIFQALGVITVLYNIWFIKRTPRIHDIGFVMTISLFIATSITLLARSKPKASDEFVWETFINFTGWSDGTTFLTGLLTTCFSFAGIDGAIHVSEECQRPRRTVPRATIASVLIGFCTAFPFSIILLYSVTDIESILNTQGYVTLAVYDQGMRSMTAAVAFTCLGLCLAFFVLNAVYQTASRVTWSFARDNGLLLSRFIGRIQLRLEVPVYAILLNWAILIICGCVFLASRTAFNAILSSVLVIQQVTYIMPAAFLLYRKRSSVFLPKDRYFRLPGILGWIINVLVVVLGVILMVVFCIPPFKPVTPHSMNYASVMIGIVAILVLANWFVHGKRHYKGPRIQVQD